MLWFLYTGVCLCLDSGEAKTTPENALPWKKITFFTFTFFTNKKFSHFLLKEGLLVYSYIYIYNTLYI